MRLRAEFLNLLYGYEWKEYDTFEQLKAAAAKLDVEFDTKNLSRKVDSMSGHYFQSFVSDLGPIYDPLMYDLAQLWAVQYDSDEYAE